MSKKNIIIIMIIVFLISTVVVFCFISFVVSPITFIDDSELRDKPKQWLTSFYNDYPELISEGNYIDVKYTDFNQFSQYNSTIGFVFKGDEYKKIKNVELTYLIKENNFEKEETLTINNFYPFDSTWYDDRQSTEKRVARIRLMCIWELGGETSHYFNDLKYTDYNLRNMKIKFNFVDNTETETHQLSVDNEKMYETKKMKLDNDISYYITNFDSDDNEVLKNIRDYMYNLSDEYKYIPERGFENILSFYETIERSPNCKAILENVSLFECFFSSGLNEMNEKQLQKVYNQVKSLYCKENFELDKRRTEYLISFLKKIDKAALTNGFVSPINSKNLLIDYSKESYLKLFQ